MRSSGSTTSARSSIGRGGSRAFIRRRHSKSCSRGTSARRARGSPRHPNCHPRLRPYQRQANEAIEKALADRRRQMLVAMATGTGKTFTMVNQVYRLMESGVGKRILFLVDRRALAAQAVRAFASFEPEPNKKFHKLHEVYSQRFQRADLGEDEPFDPNVLPAAYLADPQAKHDVRLCLHHPADGGQPFRPAGRVRARATRSTTTPSSSTSPSTPSTSSSPTNATAATPRPRVALAQHAGPFRRGQDRPDRHPRRPHHRPTSTTWSTATSMTGPSARATWWITTP